MKVTREFLHSDQRSDEHHGQRLTALRGLLETAEAGLIVVAGRLVHLASPAGQAVPQVAANRLTAQLPRRLVRRGRAALQEKESSDNYGNGHGRQDVDRDEDEGGGTLATTALRARTSLEAATLEVVT